MKLAREWILLLCVAALLAACDRSLDEIERQRALWASSRPESYAYTIQVAGQRDRPLLHPKRVNVKADGSVSAVYLWSRVGRVAGEAAPRGTFWTMDDVFGELLRAKQAGAEVRARFDESHGFVERAFVTHESTSWDVEIANFEETE